jgi:hypothetical protein
MALHPAAAFLRNYVLRRGVLQGRAGLTVSLLNSYYVLLKYVKLLELEIGTQNAEPEHNSRSGPGSGRS